MASIIVAGDEADSIERICEILRDLGHAVSEASDGAGVWNRVKEEDFDLVLLDFKEPKHSLKILREVKGARPLTPAIMIAGQGKVDEAVEAMRLGAHDFIEQPVKTIRFKNALKKALETRRLMIENLRLRTRLHDRKAPDEIIGVSLRLREVLEVIDQVAPTRATVLLSGESGTGKELIAHSVHYNSTRANGPFIKVSCAALTESLLESELFGHEKGAFTGATQQRKGRFELAHEGTLFLDEVGEMSPATQVKLLRVLQEGEFERVGGSDTLKTDIRLIAATNKDLIKAVADGTFREDLFYRLNVVSIRLPPLRERKEDIPLLAQHFMEKFSGLNGKTVKGIAQEVMLMLEAYPWPGNIRELENMMERAVVITKGEVITEEDLPSSIKESGQIVVDVGTRLDEVEKIHILKTLTWVKNDKEKAARLLGIGIASLYRKLKEYQGTT